VRMTRNPLALAEALHKLSRNGRWSGAIGRGLETLCIANPSESILDESEGWVADLLSTHPPIAKRIQILLRLAHVGMRELETEIQSEDSTKHDGESGQSRPHASDVISRGYFAREGRTASPPLGPPERLAAEEEPARQVSQFPLVNGPLSTTAAYDEDGVSDYACPACGHPLVIVSYEQTKLHRCKNCEGTLIEGEKISRLIARSCGMWSDRIDKLARMTLTQNERRLAMHRFKGADSKTRSTIPLLDCPKCGQKMVRGLYSAAYLLEVDRCVFCNLIWFDRDELDMLLCMIGKGMALHETDTAQP
jgi:Zn-finger nucleic acid-binding protein